MKIAAKIFGILAGILVIYLAIGFLLPGTWEAEADVDLPVPPSSVLPFLERVDQWRRWTPTPESGATAFGPESGPGAGLQWDDREYGKGRMEILATRGDSVVDYRVAIEEGTLQIQGMFALSPRGAGCHLVWTETGDFGWNPLMGYVARKMGESQAAAMRSSLERLRSILEGESLDRVGG